METSASIPSMRSYTMNYIDLQQSFTKLSLQQRYIYKTSQSGGLLQKLASFRRRSSFKGKRKFVAAVHCVTFGIFVGKFSKHCMNLTVDKSRVQTQDAIEKYFANDLPNSQSLKLPAISASTSHATLDIKRILSIPPVKRGISEENMLTKYLKRIHYFQEFSTHIQHKLSCVLRFESYEPGRVINKQGHYSSAAYFIWYGSALVNDQVKDVRNGSLFSLTVKELIAGECFGVEETLLNKKRNSTVVSRNRIDLLIIDKENLQEILGSALKQRAQDSFFYVSSLQQFKGLPILFSPQCVTTNYFRFNSVVTTYTDRNFTGVVVVVKRGGCKIFVKCSKQHSPNTAKPKGLLPPLKVSNSRSSRRSSRERVFQIGSIEAGESFGLELLFNIPLCTIAVVSRGAECITIDKKIFLQQASSQLKNSLTTPSGYYPERDCLKQALEEQNKWTRFKQSLTKELVSKHYS